MRRLLRFLILPVVLLVMWLLNHFMVVRVGS